jgi:hypothetical protein
MKAHPLMLRGLIVLALIVIVPIGVGIALAHGTPTIAVEATIVAAGSPISITGSGMAAGESFIITLDGLAGSIELGMVTAMSEGQAGGFTVTYTVPSGSTPGSYTVRAMAEDGDGTTADLSITAAMDQANSGPAMAQEPSAAPPVIDRSKPAGEVAAVVVLAPVSGGLGLWLARPRAT